MSDRSFELQAEIDRTRAEEWAALTEAVRLKKLPASPEVMDAAFARCVEVRNRKIDLVRRLGALSAEKERPSS